MRLNAKVFGYMAAREVIGKTPRALIVPVPTSMTPTRAFDSSSNGQHGLDVPRGRLRVSPRRVLVVGVALSWCVGETAVGIGHRCTEEQRELVHRESGTQWVRLSACRRVVSETWASIRLTSSWRSVQVREVFLSLFFCLWWPWSVSHHC